MELIAHIAEFDARKLFLPAAYGSMLTYCMGELGLSEDAAKKRIQVARASRDYPAILDALAEGRVHLAGLRLLAPRLTPENTDELLSAATHKSMDEIERLLAKRYPKSEVVASVNAIPATQPMLAAEEASEHDAGPEVVANPECEGAARHPRESGRRCEVRGEVEFEHKTEVARGGEATVDGLQLRCRGHNQFTAEQTFGAGFMQAKREAAKAAAARRKAEREAARAAAAQRRAERENRAEESRLRPHELEVIPYLRSLGCREDESRIAARCCRDMAEASLEARVKRALSWFGARCGRTIKAVRATSALPADGGAVPG